MPGADVSRCCRGGLERACAHVLAHVGSSSCCHPDQAKQPSLTCHTRTFLCSQPLPPCLPACLPAQVCAYYTAIVSLFTLFGVLIIPDVVRRAVL